jgi:hypothetical protein
LTVDPDFLEDGRVEKYLLAVSCHLKFSTSVCTTTTTTTTTIITSTQDSPKVSAFPSCSYEHIFGWMHGK